MKRSAWHDHLYLTKNERRGFIVVAVLILAVFAMTRLYPHLVSNDRNDVNKIAEHCHKLTTYTPVRRDSSWQRKKFGKSKYKKQYPKKTKKKWPRKTVVFAFDPNSLSADSLKLLGLKPYIAKNLVKYRSKGGKFRKPADLYKIYGIDSARVSELLPYVQIDSTLFAKAKQKPRDQPIAKATKQSDKIAKIKLAFIDINTADEYQWQQLRGIGPTKARIIVERRDKLGGFYAKEQLLTVWGITDSLYQSIEAQLIASDDYKTIPINKADKKMLAAHPYIPYKEAGIMVSYRNNHGPYTSAEDLKKIVAFTPEFVDKVAPYLRFD